METTILSFTWNTQSCRLAESMDPETVKGHRKGSTSYWRYESDIPDFWTTLSQKIKDKNPTIVAIGFQEDVYPGSYFHSHLLPEEMPKLGYTLFDRIKLMGVGRTSFMALGRADLFVRGLRLSVYLRADAAGKIRRMNPANTYTNSVFQNKGAAGIYLTLPDKRVLAIINTHLPFDAQSLRESVHKQDPYIRQDAVFIQNQFYNETYRRLFKTTIADEVILMGDLNYRITPYLNWSAEQTGIDILEHPEKALQGDELRYQMNKGNIYPLSEGIDNLGPQFLPTCKMQKGRISSKVTIESYSLGKEDQRVPSYCDRILNSSGVNCLEYDRFDTGMMNKSDHAGVIGLYKLNLILF